MLLKRNDITVPVTCQVRCVMLEVPRCVTVIGDGRCSSPTGSTAEIHDFTVSYCEIPPCVVHRPSNYNVNVTFTPSKAAARH